MKTIITFTFLLFSYLGFSQTTREEVVKRNDYGQKVIVNTYSGTGNSEKLVKRTTYGEQSSYSGITLKPMKIEYFGGLKYIGGNWWGVIKYEDYYSNGVLRYTWKTSDELIP
jgi:hypothetical protein